jgi:hypothetical protein
MKERGNRDLVGQRKASNVGEIQKSREGQFIKVVLMFSLAFKY